MTTSEHRARKIALLEQLLPHVEWGTPEWFRVTFLLDVLKAAREAAK